MPRHPYKKPEDKVKVRTVTITDEQRKKMHMLGLNMSKFLRDAIDALPEPDQNTADQ